MDTVIKKLDYIHQAVLFHDKFVDKLDAISLSALDVNKPIPAQVANIEFRSLKRLTKEIMEILNEGCIMHQSQTIEVQRILERCNRSLLKIKGRGLEEADLLSLDSDSSHSDGIGITLMSESLAKRPRSNSQNLEETLLATDLHKHLRQSFSTISEIMEAKIMALRLIHEIIEHYHHSIVELATSNGVLIAERRAHFIIPPRVSQLLNHKLFNVNEEEELKKQTKALWAEAVLGNSGYTTLAEVDMNQIMQRHKASSLPSAFFAKLGAASILLCWSISECYNNEYTGRQIWQDPTFAIFMCFGDLILLLLMWGISMYVWKSAGIDYIRLLDLHHTEIGQIKSPVPMVLHSFANVALVFFVVFIVFNKAMRSAWKGYINIAVVHAIPVLLTLFLLWRMIYPFETRKHWLYLLWKVLAAPWYQVDFCAGYVGDLFTSLVRVFVPFAFSMIYVAISLAAWVTNHMEWAVSSSDTWWSENAYFTLGLTPVLTLLPLWIRLVQCLRRSVETGQRWPHMVNALKYTSAMAVIAHGTFQPQLRHHPVWILSFVGATLFQFGWDVFQDWGMLEVSWISSSIGYKEDIERKRVNSNNNFWSIFFDLRIKLRSKRLLGPAWVYISIMAANLALRFAWTLTLLPIDPNALNDLSLYATIMHHIGPLIAAAEIVRRMVWGFFRLEWEQVSLIQKVEDNDDKETESLLPKHRKSTDAEECQDIEASDSNNSPLLDLPAEDGENESDDDDSVLQPLNLEMNGIASAQNSSDPFDWTQYLPRDWFDTLYHSTRCPCVSSWEGKLRLIESVVFATAVLLVIVGAAYPAFYMQ